MSLKLPTACGKILLSDEIPVSKVFVTPFINAVRALVSPCQLILNVNMIFGDYEEIGKSSRLFCNFTSGS